MGLESSDGVAKGHLLKDRVGASGRKYGKVNGAGRISRTEENGEVGRCARAVDGLTMTKCLVLGW